MDYIIEYMLLGFLSFYLSQDLLNRAIYHIFNIFFEAGIREVATNELKDTMLFIKFNV